MKVSYYLSAGGFGNGKSVYLWRNSGNESRKIARFQNDESARLFADELGFPLSDALRERLQ